MTVNWKTDGGQLSFEFVNVLGTNGAPFQFGEDRHKRQIEVSAFSISTVPVTQGLWMHLMGADTNPAVQRGAGLPLENVSWNELMRADGFLQRANALVDRQQLPAGSDDFVFRLPTEAEWEYAARGGPAWRDDFPFSGSHDIDRVAWYDRKHGDHTMPVAEKAPNQLGLYDMSGNVWEWCHDCYTRDVSDIPADGSPCTVADDRRVLRGGCFHNWAIHCKVSKRYEIERQHHDGCIGFRLVFGKPFSDRAAT